jgi:ADP-ribose pyrophosphatase YjhB (NUDIX family)
MAKEKRLTKLVRPVSAKEVSVLAWIQDAYGNVLLIRQVTGKKLWSLPGGKARSGESLKDALVRELKEEIGLTVTSAKAIDLFDRPQRCGIAVLFLTKLHKGRLRLGAKEISDAAFMSRLPAKSTPSVRYFWRRQFPANHSRSSLLEV